MRFRCIIHGTLLQSYNIIYILSFKMYYLNTNIQYLIGYNINHDSQFYNHIHYDLNRISEKKMIDYSFQI